MPAAFPYRRHPTLRMNPHPVPRKIADFEIIRRLGAGGMAEVFLAKKLGAAGTYKLLVVKRILPDHGSSQKFRRMFAEEAQLATRLNHPNIVQVYDFQDSGEQFGLLLSMEYVEGPDLRKLHRAVRAKNARLSPYVAAFIVSEAAKGLHYAHERKDEGGKPLEIVHRDVSPQNILLSFDGAVKIADFGIATARLFRQEPGVLKGKAAYMSPEQARGEKVDRRTDIYSLGVVFHELLTGRALHGSADGKELIEAVRAGTVEPPSLFVRGVPPELESIVMRALEIEPDRRYGTARDFANAITRVLFQKQQLVDSHVLEQVIAEYFSRDHTSPQTSSETARSDESFGSEQRLSPAHDESSRAELARDRAQRLKTRQGREVRHVALVALKIHGYEELEQAIGSSQALSLSHQLRKTFDNMAYRRNTDWAWKQDSSTSGISLRGARAVVGVMANPTRAVTDAAGLAVEIHEALEGACDGYPVSLRASVAIVRAVAEGRRDKGGRLTRYSLAEPSEALADLLVERVSPGQSWVAGGIYRIVRRDFIWSDRPDIPLDSLPETLELPPSMRVYALERPLTREEKRQQLSLAPRDLVGRDAELADLHAAYHQAVSVGAGGVLGQMTARVVIGEMGIGKTALVTTFLSELPPDAAQLRIECSPYRSEMPFYHAAQWLRELIGHQISDPREHAAQTIREVLGDLGADNHASDIVARMTDLATGHLAEAVDEADAALHRRVLTTGMRHLLARVAQRAPLVMMLDGLQWIDLPSLELLTALIRRAEPDPILVLLVTRPDERVLRFIEGAVRLELSGLSAENQVRLIEAHLGASQGVADACADLIPRAAGNPYFLVEMVDALLERGRLELKEEAGQQLLLRARESDDATWALPSTLEQLIADRLNELPSEEHAIIDWLAVHGGPLERADFAQLLGEDGSTAEEAITRLCARGLCNSNGNLVDVRHPLTRDVAYLALPTDDRRSMHQHLAEQLARKGRAEGLSAANIARHFAQGEHPELAAEYFLIAAGAARATFQLPLAARYYQQALEVLPPDDPRCLKPYSTLEDICRVQGRWSERREYLAQLRRCARQANNGMWIATALIRHAQFEFDAGRLGEAFRLAQLGEQAAQQVDARVQQVQAQALMAETLRDLGDTQGALAACDRALGTAEHADVPGRLKAEVLRARATLLLRVGRVREAVRVHAEVVAVFRQAGARRHEARAKSSLSYGLYALGRFEDAITLAHEAIRIDLAIGGRFQIAKTLSNIGQCFAQLGDAERARSYFKRAREAHERYEDQDSRIDTLLSSAELHIELGELDAARELLQRAQALGDLSATSYDSVHAKLIQAALARRTGQSNAAVLHAFNARQIAEAQAYVAFHFYAMALEAAARVDLGEQHTAILLATTTLGAIASLQGSEYGLETRALCLEALERTDTPQLAEMQRRAREYTRELLASIRDPELQRLFQHRPLVRRLLGTASGLTRASSPPEMPGL